MQRLKTALENLDETITALEDRVLADNVQRIDHHRKQNEVLRISRTRETNVMAVAQKVAARLDQTIQHVEQVLRD